MSGWVSHRNVDDPQPEFCSLCGTKVAAYELRKADVQGLRGFYICNTTPGCRKFRASPSYQDRRQRQPRPFSTSGDARVYPVGGRKAYT